MLAALAGCGILIKGGNGQGRKWVRSEPARKSCSTGLLQHLGLQFGLNKSNILTWKPWPVVARVCRSRGKGDLGLSFRTQVHGFPDARD